VERALFIGRFQPFHNGHLHAILEILREYDEVVIVVAAAQYNYTFENPFTAGERIEMIKRALGELYSRVYIIPIDNIPNNKLWPQHVLSYIPRVETVFSNNEFVRELFKIYGLKTRETSIVPGVSGSLIRRKIVENEEWRDMVPHAVVKFIEEINGVERIKLLYRLSIRAPGERF